MSEPSDAQNPQPTGNPQASESTPESAPTTAAQPGMSDLSSSPAQTAGDRNAEEAVEVRPTPEEAPAPKIVAVIGEIPFAGLALARELILSGTSARVLCPDAETEAALLRGCVPNGKAMLECVRGSLDSPDSIKGVCRGAFGVVFVSPITLNGRLYRATQHLDDVRAVADAARAADVERVVYHSALGAQPVSPTVALSQAALAEELFAALDCDVYRLRTSMVMGRGDHFQSELVAAAKSSSPVMGMPGYGSTMLQPIHVNDLARCITRIFNPNRSMVTPGVYCVAGPEVTTPLDLADLALERLGRLKLKVHMPLFVLKLLASMRRDAAFREKVNLLFEGFCTDHNDSFRLLGNSYALTTPRQSQDEILAAA